MNNYEAPAPRLFQPYVPLAQPLSALFSGREKQERQFHHETAII